VSTETEETSNSFKEATNEMRSGGAQRQARQDEILEKYGSAVDRDVGIAAPKTAGEAFIKLLEQISIVNLTEEMKGKIKDRRYTIIGEFGAASTLATKDKGTFIEVKVTYQGNVNKTPRFKFMRFTNGKGKGVFLDYTHDGKLSEGGFCAEDVFIDNNHIRIPRPGGSNFSADGKLAEKPGKIDIPEVVKTITNPETLGQEIDLFANV